MAISFSARVVVPSHVLLQQVGEESVLLNLEKESYYGLDPVGTRMWGALTRAVTVEAAYQELLAEYEVDAAQLRRDMAGLIEKLVENGLLETSPSPAPPRRASEGRRE
ncbi:MAG TPA: PqqD family protein [Candidatus Acidoferrales bacterium]|nr:PqqD family protein [Candidatus Acidoferrales bacterium]